MLIEGLVALGSALEAWRRKSAMICWRSANLLSGVGHICAPRRDRPSGRIIPRSTRATTCSRSGGSVPQPICGYRNSRSEVVPASCAEERYRRRASARDTTWSPRRNTEVRLTRRWRELDSNRRSLSCTHRPLVAEGNAVAIERGSLVIVVFLMRARGIPLPLPVCPSASEIAARSPRITAARDGVAAAPGLSCQRASGQCDVGTVRPPDSPPLSPACGKQNSDTCFDQ